jgi:hypothetical protein
MSQGSHYLAVGDKPWYCFWNSTISEFWVFLDQNMDDANQTVTSPTSMITGSPTASASSMQIYGGTYPTPFPYNSLPTPTGPASTVSGPEPAQTSETWPARRHRNKRQSFGSPDFPKLVKMVEKRKPDDNATPYCQQMQVLNDWQIMPIPDIPIINIDESEFSEAQPTSRRLLKRRGGDTTQQLNSNCICEWFSV